MSVSTSGEESAPGPLELLESAKVKHQLAAARLRRGPPELALLSMHGAVEDVLRAHGLRLGLPEAYAPFAQLLDALTAATQRPLSAAEAEGIRRMHRLRARVAHGEQIVVTRETIEAYQRLATRLLPRYGVLVVGPQEGGAPEADEPFAATTTTAVVRRDRDTLATLNAAPAAPGRRGDTARIERAPQPPRERTVYPDSPARYMGRARPSRATADLPLAREWAAAERGEGRRYPRGSDLWSRAQGWLLPALAILCIFLIGAVISVSLQQMRAEPLVPTAALPLPSVSVATAVVPQITTLSPATGGDSGAGVPTAAPSAGPPNALAPGRTAYVLAESGGLNVRGRPGTAADNPILFSLAPGTSVEVVGGPVESDGFIWWQVRGPTGEGWCAGQFLEVR